MPKFQLNKIIRDDLVEISEKLGITVDYVRLEGEDAIAELFAKGEEESKEGKQAKEKEKQIGELADLQTVVDALRERLGVSKETLEQIVEKKKQEKGGFDKGLYVRTMEMDEENPRCAYYRNDPEKYPEIK